MGSILQVKNIETLYYGLIKALRGISLDIQEGTISVVLGGNGAGKTTTLKTIMGLLEDQPDKGTIEFIGKRIDGLDAEDIVNLGIAMVPEGRKIFPELTVVQKKINERIVPVVAEIFKALRIKKMDDSQEFALNFLIRGLIIAKITYMIEAFRSRLNERSMDEQSLQEALLRFKPQGSA